MEHKPNGSADVAGLEALARLEERIVETVEQLRAAREETGRARSEVTGLRDQLGQSDQRNRKLAAELESLQAERRRILERVEKLLARIDTVTQG